MKRCLVLLAVLLAAGCSAHTQIRVGAASLTSVQSGNAFSASSGGLSLSTNSVAGALIGLGLIGAALHPPELDPERSVAERDCSRPFGHISANLRCR